MHWLGNLLITLCCFLKTLYTVSTNFQWTDLLVGGVCQDGKKLEKVDGNALDKFCPVDSCSDYIPETGMPNLPTWSEPQVSSILPSSTEVLQDFQNILLYRSSLLSTMATSSTKEKLMTKKMMEVAR